MAKSKQMLFKVSLSDVPALQTDARQMTVSLVIARRFEANEQLLYYELEGEHSGNQRYRVGGGRQSEILHPAQLYSEAI